MPRKARIDAPGALHHIILRGIERRIIFQDDLDYQNFRARLGRVLAETETPCYAWAQMPNHVHLLLRTGEHPISTVMRRLLTGYAQQFNRRHHRNGYLFQNRYKSILCEEDAYLKELVRYIHLNPLRAGIVKDLNALTVYSRSGHAALMGRSQQPWQHCDYVLKFFGDTMRSARKSYANFISRGIAMGRRPDLVGGGLVRSSGGWAALKAIRLTGERIMGDERILGGSDFVDSVLKSANENYEKRTRLLAHGLTLDQLITVVTDYFEMDQSLLKSASRQRKVARVRSLICCLAVDSLLVRGTEVARMLKLSASAVSKLASRGRKDPLLKQMERKLF